MYFLKDQVKNVDLIWCDQITNLLKDNLYFEYSGSENVFKLAGNGLILGVDKEGESISPTLTIEDVKGKVNFLPEGFKVEPYMEFRAWD